MTTIDFENGANFITAKTESGEVVVRCNFQYTDCRDDETLSGFVARHGGKDAAASYLVACYKDATSLFR